MRELIFAANNVSHVAFARTMCHVGTKSARPLSLLSPSPSGDSLTKPRRLYFHGSIRRGRSDGKKLSIPSTSSGRSVKQRHDNRRYSQYLQTWKLKPNTPKMLSVVFHVNRKLNVS